MSKPSLERLLDDWPAKILSLAAAIALFFFYQLNRLEERPLSVPLTVVSNEGFVPASAYPRTVRLVLRGESNGIYAVLEGDLEATLDLRGYTAAGVWRVPVRVEKRGSALGIDPLEISVDPPDVLVSIEPRVVKEVPVVPSFRGFLEPGYELVGFKLAPSRIEVAGPASVMEALGDAATEPIELTGRGDNFSTVTRIALRDPLVTLLSSSAIEFSAEVKKAIVYRTLSDIDIRQTGLRAGLASDSSFKGTARVSGSSIELENYKPLAGVLEADLSAIAEPGTYAVAVSPHFPAGLDVESWSPMVVYVSVQENGAEDDDEAEPRR